MTSKIKIILGQLFSTVLTQLWSTAFSNSLHVQSRETVPGQLRHTLDLVSHCAFYLSDHSLISFSLSNCFQTLGLRVWANFHKGLEKKKTLHKISMYQWKDFL